MTKLSEFLTLSTCPLDTIVIIVSLLLINYKYNLVIAADSYGRLRKRLATSVIPNTGLGLSTINPHRSRNSLFTRLLFFANNVIIVSASLTFLD